MKADEGDADKTENQHVSGQSVEIHRRITIWGQKNCRLLFSHPYYFCLVVCVLFVIISVLSFKLEQDGLFKHSNRFISKVPLKDGGLVAYSNALSLCLFISIPVWLQIILDLRSSRYDFIHDRWQVISRLSVMILLSGWNLFIRILIARKVSTEIIDGYVGACLSSQAACIILFLLCSIYRYEKHQLDESTEKIKLFRSDNFKKYIMRAAAITILSRLFGLAADLTSHPGIILLFSILWGIGSSSAICLFLYISVSIILATFKRHSSNMFWFQTARDMSDFFNAAVIVVSMLHLPLFVLIFRFGNQRIVHVFVNPAVAVTWLYIIYEIMLLVIPQRCYRFQAEIEHQQLQNRLNLIRYVSHELRSPLNNAFMGLKLVDSMFQAAKLVLLPDGKQALQIEKETFDELVDTILQVNGSCVIASETVDELLTYDKLDEKKLEISVNPINPWNFVQKSSSPFQLKARAKGISFHVSLNRQSGIDDWVSRYCLVADEFKMNQVIRNLVSNAIKFTPSGGSVDARVEMVANYASSHIDSQDRTGGRLLRITVRDSGAGISRENMKRLFGQYVQINASALKHGEGSGLGLWISKSIVELHGGTLTVSSEGESHGSTFTVQLPLVRADSIGSTDARSPENTAESTQPHRVATNLRSYGIAEVDEELGDVSTSHSTDRIERDALRARQEKAGREAPTATAATTTTMRMGACVRSVAARLLFGGGAGERIVATTTSPSQVLYHGGNNFLNHSVQVALSTSRKPPAVRGRSNRVAVETDNNPDSAPSIHIFGAGTRGETSRSSHAPLLIPAAKGNAPTVKEDSDDELLAAASVGGGGGGPSLTVSPRSMTSNVDVEMTEVHLFYARTIEKSFESHQLPSRNVVHNNATTVVPGMRCLRLLIVDDSLSTRKLMTRIFTSYVDSEHFMQFSSIDTADSGEQCLEMYRAAMSAIQNVAATSNITGAIVPSNSTGLLHVENDVTPFAEDDTSREGSSFSQNGSSAPYDVILMDQNMLALSGPETAATLRSWGYKGLLLGITGITHESELDHFRACGANAVFTKPVNMDQVAIYIRDHYFTINQKK